MITYIREALEVLFANRLRTTLSLLGLIVGVAAVIAIQVLGHAMSGALAGAIQGLSQQAFIAYPNTRGSFDVKSGFYEPQIRGLNDLPNVRLAIANDSQDVVAEFAHRRVRVSLSPTGAQPEFLSQSVAQGRSFTDADVAGNAYACIISNAAAEKLSPSATAALLGARLRLGNYHCTVEGILQKPPAGAINFNFSSDIVTPYTTYDRQFLRGHRFYSVQVLVADTRTMSATEDAVKHYLGALHANKFRYGVFDNELVAGALNKVFVVVTAVVGLIGAISLVVSGIGIMNILLVSITERTREIGVRKAIGAKRRQILFQFFLEAAFIALIGCLGGMVLGLLIGWFVNSRYIIAISGVIVALPWVQSVVLAVVFATIITFAFGTFPAYRAARLDPIEALRYE